MIVLPNCHAQYICNYVCTHIYISIYFLRICHWGVGVCGTGVSFVIQFWLFYTGLHFYITLGSDFMFHSSFISLFIVCYISNKTHISIYINIYWLLDACHLRGHTLLVQLAAHIFVLVALQKLYNWPGLSIHLGLLVTQDTLAWAPLYFVFI